jgi:hypothetical protein
MLWKCYENEVYIIFLYTKEICKHILLTLNIQNVILNERDLIKVNLDDKIYRILNQC